MRVSGAGAGTEGTLLTIAFATLRDDDGARPLVKHLLDTCGLRRNLVEVLVYAANRRGLCGVYNDALRKAAGRYLVLLHDDVSFERSPGWAKTLVGVFERNPRFSILGLAGSSILQESGYWGHEQVMCGHVYHRVNGTVRLDRFALPHEEPVRAASLDGVFLSARSADVRDLVLDEERFDGFHFYDAELCMQANLRGLRIGVTDALDLIHFSTGNFGDGWRRHQRVFKEKYGARLPYNPLETEDLFPFRRFACKPKTSRSVAVLIPVRNRAERVRNAVRAIANRWSGKARPAIYLVDAGAGPAALASVRNLAGATLLETGCKGVAAAFNEVVLRRDVVREDLLLLHDDEAELVNDAPSHLLHAWETTPHPGVVGARLHFPNGLVRSAGASLVVDPRLGLVALNHGYNTLWDFSEHTLRGAAFSPLALALMETSLYRKAGGLSEEYGASLEEVELGLRCVLAGRTNVHVGDAVVVHHGRVAGLDDEEERATVRGDLLQLKAFVEANLDALRGHIEFLPGERADAEPARESGKDAPDRSGLWADPNRYARPAGIELADPVVVHGYQEFQLGREWVRPLPEDGALERKRQLVERFFQPGYLGDKTLLDLGANGGFFTFWGRQSDAARVTALDMDHEYLQLIRTARKRVGLDRIHVVHAKVQDWEEPADVVLAFAMVHWLYSCTATYGSLDAVIGKLADLARELLIVEWVAPEDPAIEFFRHTDWNSEAIREPYTLAAFEEALRARFPRVEILGEISPTRVLYAAHRSLHEVTACEELPRLAPAERVISSRCLTELDGTGLWSIVYRGEPNGRIWKQTTGDLAWNEAGILARLSGPRFPRLVSVRREDGYSVAVVEWIEGEDLVRAEPHIAADPAALARFFEDGLDILASLRAAGIRHRDIRIANFRVRDGRPVLLDFGWAEIEGEPGPVPGGLGAEGRPPDGSFCDVYSMGVVFRRLARLDDRGRFAPFIEAMTEPDPARRVTDPDVLRAILSGLDTGAALAAEPAPASAAPLGI